MRTEVARKLLSAAKLDELLKRNVIAQYADDTLSFHSRVVETYFRAVTSSSVQV